MNQDVINQIFKETVALVKAELDGQAPNDVLLTVLNYKLQVAAQEVQQRQVVPAGGSIVNA